MTIYVTLARAIERHDTQKPPMARITGGLAAGDDLRHGTVTKIVTGDNLRHYTHVQWFGRELRAL